MAMRNGKINGNDGKGPVAANIGKKRPAAPEHIIGTPRAKNRPPAHDGGREESSDGCREPPLEKVLAINRMASYLLEADSGRWLQMLIEEVGKEKVADELEALTGNREYLYMVVAQKVTGFSASDIERACSDEDYARQLSRQGHGRSSAGCSYWKVKKQLVDEKTAMVLEKAQKAIKNLS